MLAILIRARLGGSAIQMHQVRPRNEHVGSLILTRVTIHGGRLRSWPARPAPPPNQRIDNIIVRPIELALREEGKQVLISSVTIHDDHFFAAVPSHFVRGLL